jgi:hypothetical protein
MTSSQRFYHELISLARFELAHVRLALAIQWLTFLTPSTPHHLIVISRRILATLSADVLATMAAHSANEVMKLVN